MPENNGYEEKPNFYTLYQKVGNIDGKLDTVLKQIENHDTRINCIEKTQDMMVGKISIFGAVAGFVGGIITTIIGWFGSKG